MSTDQQLAETALCLVDTKLAHLAADPIGELLAEHERDCADAGQGHNAAPWEMGAVQRGIEDAVAALRRELTRYAAACGIPFTGGIDDH